MREQSPGDRWRVDVFCQNTRTALMVLALSLVLLGLTLAAGLLGPGFDPRSNDPLWLALACLFLAGLAAAAGWLLWRRPAVLRIGPAGLDLPFAFRSPLPWAQIHRVRRLHRRKTLTTDHDWLVVEPSPGILPDYRLPSPRRIELWWIRKQGIRIPLHALDAEPEIIVASIERFRPVMRAPT